MSKLELVGTVRSQIAWVWVQLGLRLSSPDSRGWFPFHDPWTESKPAGRAGPPVTPTRHTGEPVGGVQNALATYHLVISLEMVLWFVCCHMLLVASRRVIFFFGWGLFLLVCFWDPVIHNRNIMGFSCSPAKLWSLIDKLCILCSHWV